MSGLWLGATAATLWFGGREVVNGNLEPGGLTAFLLYLYILQMPVRMFGWVIMIGARANAAGLRIFEILDAESAVTEKHGAKELSGVEGHVQFQDVSFGYDAISPVLSHIDIVAKPEAISDVMCTMYIGSIGVAHRM